jgi:hypothetical protein
MTEASDERYTPPHVLDVVRRFDRIACDPCTVPGNPCGAAYAHTLADNGLEFSWTMMPGVVYVNPPYSRGQLPLWVEKCYKEALRGAEVVALIPSDLGSRAGQRAASTADALCFVKGRLTFGTPDGAMPQGAKQPSVLVYWGERAKRFALIFSELGVVWRKQ